jgi:hypothetical protein
MAQPANGVSFKKAGLAYINALRARRGGRWQVIARDYGGVKTNISPGSAFGSPMALAPGADGGMWRDDLFAVLRTSTGKWVYNQKPNLGFYPFGYVDVDGIERAPKVTSDPGRGLQSIDPLRVDVQDRDKTLMFTPLERTPFVDAIEFNQPLAGVLERAAAEGTYFVGESSDDEPLRRQVFVMHEDKQGGLSELNAFPFPRCVLSDQGSKKGNRKDWDAAKITLSREIDPFFVDEFGVPMLDGRWSAGSLWDQDNVPALTFTQSVPVVTPTAATTANAVFATPIGGVSPYTYAVEKSADGETGWAAATAGAPSVANGLVTLALTALTTATTAHYRVKATDADGEVALSAVTPAVTQP